ncbi:hypothetical protein [Treponema phagedenis]|uniref:Uncharacterized protein n=1 Tax=Treponema phagedenis TaxID=162 RepID=A0AAE6M6H2_TREPH|nr:hypothetical protein [Treponema phagedenis]QEJ97471.1 hypothetical protein FUT82_05295 [Treponema phagedenis]QEK03042.1 hypothetical protein FUT83_03920 [Treponema phagedenis]QEK08668.1 hypothetical protein FUT81_03905 [Treponema phagedenis]
MNIEEIKKLSLNRRKTIAKSEKTPQNILLSLAASDPHRYVRGAVAENINVTADILEILLEDDDLYVRNKARERLGLFKLRLSEEREKTIEEKAEDIEDESDCLADFEAKKARKKEQERWAKGAEICIPFK